MADSKRLCVQGSTLRTCIVGSNSYVGRGCDIQDTIILGNDSYTNEASRALSRKKGEVVLGIGESAFSCSQTSICRQP